MTIRHLAARSCCCSRPASRSAATPWVDIEKRLSAEQLHATGLDTLKAGATRVAQPLAARRRARTPSRPHHRAHRRRPAERGEPHVAVLGFNDEPILPPRRYAVAAGNRAPNSTRQRPAWKVLKGHYTLHKPRDNAEVQSCPAPPAAGSSASTTTRRARASTASTDRDRASCSATGDHRQAHAEARALAEAVARALIVPPCRCTRLRTSARPMPRPPSLRSGVRLGLHEQIEHLRHQVGVACRCRRPRLRCTPGASSTWKRTSMWPPSRRVLRRVGEQVREHLPHARGIAQHAHRRPRACDTRTWWPLAFDQGATCSSASRTASREVHLAHVQRRLAVRDARDVQQVVDQVRHVLHLAFDDFAGRAHAVGIARREAQQRCGGGDRRQRVAQFVRERRQEPVLALVGVAQRVLAAFERFLHELLFVDLGARAHPAHDRARRVADRQRAAERPAVFAAAVAQAILDLVGLAGLRGCGANAPMRAPGRRDGTCRSSPRRRSSPPARRCRRTTGGCNSRGNRRAASTTPSAGSSSAMVRKRCSLSRKASSATSRSVTSVPCTKIAATCAVVVDDRLEHEIDVARLQFAAARRQF